MTMFLYYLLEIATTFTESYICYRFNNLFLKPELEKKKCILLSLTLTMLIFLLNTMSLFSISTLFIAIIFVIISTYIIFKAPLFDTFSITAFYSFCLIFFDFFSITELGLYLGSNDFAAKVTAEHSLYRCVFILFSKILLLLTYILIKKIIIKVNLFKSRNLIFITLVGYVGVIYFAKLTFESINLHIAISWFLLLVIIILLIFSFIAYINYYKEAERKTVISMRNDMLYKNYQEISATYQANTILYHDLRNHLMVLNHLLKNKNYEQANLFVEQLLSRAVPGEFKNYTWTGNDIIDCIINTKKDVCKQFNIKITIDADPIDVDLDLFVISAVLPNLMDNAIDACKKCEESKRWLYVAVRYINNLILIKIENSIKELPVLQGNILVTTKNSLSKHGLGMKSVEMALEQANGVLHYSFDPDKFTILVTIFLPSRAE